MTNKPIILGVLIETVDVIVLAKFYRDNFQFEVSGKLHPEWSVLTTGNCQLAIKKTSTIKRLLKLFYRKTASTQLMIAVQDVENTRIQLSKTGIIMYELQFHDQHCFCTGQDPDGNLFQITTNSYC